MPTTALATTMLDRLTEVYEGARDPVKAVPMVAYMRDQFPYLGLPAPTQVRLNREILAGLPKPVEADLRVLATECWKKPEREYQYFAINVVRRHIASCSPAFLPLLRRLIVTKSWWDTVDPIGSRIVGMLVATHPRLVTTMDAWALDDNKWLARTAIIHQLYYTGTTDTERLFSYCAAQAGHPDFFIRKAIGWALRQYAYTDPEAVRAFVHGHPELSGLSKREALRRL
jgi:3-methyladenine DNA glycosylase AlkD